jgi:dTDP-4-dehydrorhamnose 3,5-epimerase
MRIIATDIDGLIVFEPTPFRDERGFFTRTLDVDVLARAGIDPASFKQDSQSRSFQGVVRGIHGRLGSGEAKLVRCAHGSVFDVVVDARSDSRTFGEVRAFVLDDEAHRQVYIPRGFLHGHQTLTPTADVCYRIDEYYAPGTDVTVRYDDPVLAVEWPAPVTVVSEKDREGLAWHEFAALVGRP